MIEVKNIKKSFGESEVLKGISAIFEAGKTNLIIGSSGAGKTVFIKSLLGLEQPNSGDIFYNGQSLLSMNKEQKSQLRSEIGMVFQGGALFDSETVEQNVSFPLRMFTKLSSAEMQKTAHKALRRVNLEGADKKLPSELSGGMKKRVAIARAIIMQPKYLFCDEPNSGLDPKTSIVIDKLIDEITKEYNICTVINTHDMNSVMEIGEKIIFLKNGLKAWEGSSKDILLTENEDVIDFVYSSPILRELRETKLNSSKK